MKSILAILALIGLALAATPASAAMKAARDTPADAGIPDCKSLLAAKGVKKEKWQKEMAECLSNPAAFQ
jgi:hypothetical protein